VALNRESVRLPGKRGADVRPNFEPAKMGTGVGNGVVVVKLNVDGLPLPE
jgi:hypothetical protein